MAHRWYIVQAYSNFEKHVQKAIEREAEEKGLSDLFEEILGESRFDRPSLSLD